LKEKVRQKYRHAIFMQRIFPFHLFKRKIRNIFLKRLIKNIEKKKKRKRFNFWSRQISQNNQNQLEEYDYEEEIVKVQTETIEEFRVVVGRRKTDINQLKLSRQLGSVEKKDYNLKVIILN